MDINLSLGIVTKIDAVNQVLSAIGSVGISSDEELEWNVDAGEADKLVDIMSQQVQTNQGKGWWFNRESFHKLTPDPVTGAVVVPNNTISAFIKRGHLGVKSVSLRGTQFFDSETLGYDMSSLVNSAGVIECILIVTLEFEFLPVSVKKAISDAARFWVVNDKEGDKLKMEALKQAANASYISVQSEDASQRRRNMLNNNGIATAIAKAGGWNNN
jgi:hypothetical protein